MNISGEGLAENVAADPELDGLRGGGDDEECDGKGRRDSCELATGAADYDGNGVLDVCDPLSATANEASVAVLGQVDFSLRAGAVHAGEGYQLLGSMTGTTPGTQLGVLTLPLNSSSDPWFALTSMVFNAVILQDTVGTLDANGEAQATLLVPPLGSLLGLQFHHAFVVRDSQSQPVFVSNAMPLLMVL